MSRINLWKVSLRIAELHPINGGGFRVTFWPNVTNNMLRGTDLARLEKPRAAHSIYFDVLSEHGWVGLSLFLIIFGYSWINCRWLTRHSATDLISHGQTCWEEWGKRCSSATRPRAPLHRRRIWMSIGASSLFSMPHGGWSPSNSPQSALCRLGAARLPVSQQAVGPAVLEKPDNALGYAKTNP